jgi:hypothetical protein
MPGKAPSNTPSRNTASVGMARISKQVEQALEHRIYDVKRIAL